MASEEWLKKLFENGQVATQYVDLNGNPTMDEEWNLNGSYCAIEGITSPDGRMPRKDGACGAPGFPCGHEYLRRAGYPYFRVWCGLL